MTKRFFYLLQLLALSDYHHHDGRCEAFLSPIQKRPRFVHVLEEDQLESSRLSMTTKDNNDDDDDEARSESSSSSTASLRDSSNDGSRNRNDKDVDVDDDNKNVFGDFVKKIVQRVAQLSLEDYKWRSDLFKTMDANRLLDVSLARMRGDPAPGFFRPMDAPTQGPLGTAEASAVRWLANVIEEEGRRAKLMATGEYGVIVRPIDVNSSKNNNDNKIDKGVENDSNDNPYISNTRAAASTTVPLGPLAELEQRWVDFWKTLQQSEQARNSMSSSTGGKLVRPKDLVEDQRGPLGNAEYRLYQALQELSQAETLRYQVSKERGTPVRPMDVPGPLGEVEAAVWNIFQAEQRRAQESKEQTLRKDYDDDMVPSSTSITSTEQDEDNATTTGKRKKVIVRPMNASVKGPLGEAEQEAIRAIQRLSEEEKERLRGIFKKMEESRPMETNRNSIMGVTETVIVGVWRAPRLIKRVFDRVSELLQSEPLLPLISEEQKDDTELLPKKNSTIVLKMPPNAEDDLGAFQ